MLSGIDCYGDRVCVIHSSLVFGGEWLPGSFSSLPFQKEVVFRSSVVLVCRLQRSFMSEDLSELPDSIPGLVLFDKVDNVVVRDNFLIVIRSCVVQLRLPCPI